MRGQFRKHRRWFHNGRVWSVLLALSLASCQRRPQLPAAAPPPNYLELGGQSYDAGDFPAAISAYSEYLRNNPDAVAGDLALFRLGMSYSVPSNPSHDPEQAFAYWKQLVSQFPSSPLRPEAELLTGLHEQIGALVSEAAEREARLADFGRELEQLNQQQVSERDRLQGEMKDREERIRQLSEELEKLKAIDMQRRPAIPPR
jgi:tetratricopeptide (TPR) repeat protein